MKILFVLKKIDTKANKICSTFEKSFLGKVFIKLVSEIVLACLIAAAVYCATNMYYEAKAVSDDNDKLNQIYISMSEEYVASLFGAPYISFVDSNNLANNYYVLNESILRTVVDNNSIVAFFITSTNIKSRIPIISISEERKTIGKIVYSDVDFPNPQVEGNINGNGRYVYYSETQETGRYAMYNSYVFGFLPYGFIDNSTSQLINSVVFKKNNDSTPIEEFRKKAKPNTFGIIATDYENLVPILPFCEEWESMYYLLTKA